MLGLEARGIERVPESLRSHEASLRDYVQIALIWFSSNLTANNIILGFLGPLTFNVGLVDGMVVATFGLLVGCSATSYISTFGPVSGNRTLVMSRYTMGWWPSRLCVLLNLVILLGYGLVDTLIAGQILSAVNGHGLTIIVGTIIACLISLFICLLGINLFHKYERYAFIPQLLVCFILIGVAGPHFDTSSPPTTGSSASTRAADRMSWFFLCVSGPLGWAPAAADFFVYFPATCRRWKVWAASMAGLVLSTTFTLYLGVGIASGIASQPAWAAAYSISSGAVLVQVLAPLGTFGHFCAVLLSLGVIANNVPGTYSAALCFQMLGRWCMAIPRFVWTIVAVIIYTACACAGRNQFFEVFQNFLSLMGYWTAIWCALTLEEELLFRGGIKGYDWTLWNSPRKLPVGLAGLLAFCIGWVGAVLGMWQTYFTGPLGKLVGRGIDLGLPVAVSWAALTFPPLRWLERRVLGR
ncbi:hypothetical protein ASPZODRAFT_154396 [Penicilliopsis zonata CBS 506.65]|uniref:Purine-cytosine permease FCY21 n=1 Tax=Penicilliopsis zonata CBS 506.65 TaxID=1073090 RepID=A0A1L9S9V0_9EURO|nr:hypothetical protein ASPZODRAFT_154396 [Penicilliopsis zonata CBS 506.65]OJJ43911.1 hypothetical protein ASPZODRAFT_154396 [Penicilliopsis zonata CBS 506.65]